MPLPSVSTIAPALLNAVAVVLVLGIVMLVFALAIAPVRGVHNVAECQSAYARAHTRRDSMEVDFRSFPDSTGHAVTRRCGELRTTVAGAGGSP